MSDTTFLNYLRQDSQNAIDKIRENLRGIVQKTVSTNEEAAKWGMHALGELANAQRALNWCADALEKASLSEASNGS
jgi:hypothetical protein